MYYHLTYPPTLYFSVVQLTTEEIPSHDHAFSFKSQDDVEIHGSSEVHNVFREGNNDQKKTNMSVGDKPHNNIHPVIITHVWIRES